MCVYVCMYVHSGGRVGIGVLFVNKALPCQS